MNDLMVITNHDFTVGSVINAKALLDSSTTIEEALPETQSTGTTWRVSQWQSQGDRKWITEK